MKLLKSNFVFILIYYRILNLINNYHVCNSNVLSFKVTIVYCKFVIIYYFNKTTNFISTELAFEFFNIQTNMATVFTRKKRVFEKSMYFSQY